MAKREPTASEETNSYCYPHAHIPHEVILQILENLPVKSLMKFTCVSKLWFKSIVNDKRFQEAHFLKSQKNPILMFKLLTSKVDNKENYPSHHLFYLPKDEFGIAKRNKVFPQLQKLTVLKTRSWRSFVGTCNGLDCFHVGDRFDIVDGNWSYFVNDIFNFCKHEKIRIVSRIHTPEGMRIQGFRFGYDCLSNKYKLICILNIYRGGDAVVRYKYLILELGCGDSELWREIKYPATAAQGGSSTQPSHCINGVLYWWMLKRSSAGYDRALVSFDLHAEKFQVIKLPNNFRSYFEDHDHQLEYRRSLCLARMKKSDDYRGAVELYILKDRIKQVWVEETITFDRPVTRGIPPSTGIKIQIIELAGRIFLHWGEFLVREGIKNPIIYFYDLQSREVSEVKLGCKFRASNNRVSNHIENLICLRAWATKEGDGEKLGLIYDTSTLKIMEDMFKEMPPTLNAAVSLFSSSKGITMS